MCFVLNEELTDTLYDAMEAYIIGDSVKGDSLMDATKPLYDIALASCTMYPKYAAI